MGKIIKVLSFIGNFIKKHKGWLIWAILFFVAFTAYRFIIRSEERKNALTAERTQETATVETRNLVDTISATGTVESAKVRTLASTIIKDTKITSVNCEVGDQVEEGDILVTFSYESINKSIAQLQEDIAKSKATEAINDTASTRTYYYSYGTESMTIRDFQTAIEEKQKALNEA